ncbi:1-acyl-sn-glycerol-3-phosphate acyltransferase [soil metagenome]
MSDKRKTQQIDVEQIIRTKNPRLLKMLPAFVLNYLKRVVHQKDFNAFIHQTKDSFAHDFVKEAIKNFDVNVECTGLENIPDKGGCIVVCNHPLGGLDGIAVMHEVGKVRPDIKALVNDILMTLENLSMLLIPINKHGKNAIDNIRKINNAYASDECLIVFPAGLVSRKQKGKIKDLEWKKSFVTKAVRHKHTIIPLYVEAKNSSFFYNLARLRKKVGIKVNIEMFFLVDEAYKQKGKTIRLIIGQPISSNVFDKKYTDEIWAEKVQRHIYELKENKELVFGDEESLSDNTGS